MTHKDTVLNFLDIETTGGNYKIDKIIEIHIKKVLNSEIIDTFQTLVNPGFKPSDFIFNLTNIPYSELQKSPDFESIAEDLYDFLADGMIVAHNARFDYSFIKKQLKDYGYDTNYDYCCTVKLSRFLYPQYKTHRLDSVIERIGFDAGDRHRAEYDTEAIRQFFFKSLAEHGEEKFEKAFKNSLKVSAIPEALLNLRMGDIPDTPGVYLFYGESGYPLYIGMSKHLRTRIYEHFYQDLTNSKDSAINQQLKKIDYIETAGVLGALVREALLVKKYQPLYNRKLRENKNLIKLEQHKDENGYIHVSMNSDNDFSMEKLESIIGVFRSKYDLKEKLNSLVKEQGLCPKLLGLEKGKGACFAFQLGQCKGACVGRIEPHEYNAILLKAFEDIKIENWPFESVLELKEERDSLSEVFTFDKWCLVSSSLDDELFREMEKFKFDLDIYRILVNHLKRM